MDAKSCAIALALLYKEDLTIDEAVSIARVDERYQTKHFGVVEGAHDYDEALTVSNFATAKSMLNLALLPDF